MEPIYPFQGVAVAWETHVKWLLYVAEGQTVTPESEIFSLSLFVFRGMPE